MFDSFSLFDHILQSKQPQNDYKNWCQMKDTQFFLGAKYNRNFFIHKLLFTIELF